MKADTLLCVANLGAMAKAAGPETLKTDKPRQIAPEANSPRALPRGHTARGSADPFAWLSILWTSFGKQAPGSRRYP